MSVASSIMRGSIVYSSRSSSPRVDSSAVGIDLGQEADAAGVDAQDRDVDSGQRPRGAQKGSVAAEHDQALGVRETSHEIACLARLRRPGLSAVPLAPLRGALRELDRRPAWWG